MADGRHFVNRKIATSQWKRNLVHYIRYWTRWQSCDEKLNFLKSKMAVVAILKIAFLAITHKPIVRFQRSFVWGSRMACRQGLHDKNCKFLKSKMADGRHFENRKIAISQWKNRLILMKFGTLQQLVNQIAVSWPKIEIFNIQDGGCRHLENRFFGHNSSTDCPISATFCMRKQNGMSTRATWQKLQIFKIQDGGRPPFCKS